ncbi:acyltransferase family protein [Sphingomonas kyeonggiensis]|uniref:Peptidoglycan/LPS O-acetylase OafA/YrhL n=1 Tax=Sphingomonas kyeonggiensis TaxID=1268553 RepID=A0A7W6JT35_9SPHN|nr:peptidoglycan/LPS O-acetylase OafA/YrhL [Sphingomonas kyeonggiensis]
MAGERAGQGSGYIPAIDGLRAIAVTSVILFHLWPRTLPGGFTGVDVFFVISGFVVTGSLMGREFASLGQLAGYFYARRLMRIMPALVAMLLVTLLATQLFIPDSWLSNSLPQVGRFAFLGLSNVVLATDTDSYFGPQAAYNPFTHSWSLGVEEQFYLFFPFLLWWHHKLQSGARAVRLVAILSGLSLLLCAVLGLFATKFAFYLIFPRFWELGTGMLLCLTRERWQPWAAGKNWLAPLGALLVAAGFALPEGPLFPFPGALLPVAGTALVIMAILGGTAPRALGSRPMVAVGLLSYSLYLWHWPVFVLFRWTVGLHALKLQLAALVIAVALAIFSYFLVEKPPRASRLLAGWPRGRVVAVALAGVLVAMLGGQLLIAAHNRITLSVTRDRFAWYAEPGRPLPLDLTGCVPIDGEEWVAGGKVALWTPRCARPEGFTLFVPADSHGLAYTPALRRLAAETGASVRLYFKPGCPYLKLIQTHASRPKCAGWYQGVEKDIAARSKPGDVVFLPGLRVTRLANQFENDRDLVGARADTVSDAALAEAQGITQQLAAGGARLVLEAPKPTFPSPTFRCADWFNRTNPACHGLTIGRETMLERRRHVMRAMSALVASEKPTILWDPLPIFCPGQTCEALPGGRPLFFDGDHPSGLGNDLIYADLKRTILGVR